MNNSEGKSMNTATTVRGLMPLKVQFRAKELGVHETCLEADHSGACELCKIVMFEAFDHYYGHAESSEDALMMILSDILLDREALS